MLRRGTLAGLWLVVGVACGSDAKPEGEQTSPSPSAEGSAAPTATASAAASAPAVVPVPGPVAWERAYRAALGPRPAEPTPEPAAKKPYPACANHTARAKLKEKFADEIQKQGFAEQLAEAAASNDATRGAVAANAIRRDLDAALGRGFFLTRVKDARKLKSFPAPGQLVEADAQAEPPPEVARWQAELAKIEVKKDGFLCDVIGVHHGPEFPSARVKAARSGTNAEATTSVHWVACDVSGTALRTAVPIPERLWQVKVEARDGATLLGGYSSRDIASAELRSALSGETSAFVGKRLRDRGVTRLERFEHGPLAYKRLSELGFPNKLAVAAAEYKNLWITSFDAQCEGSGLGCDERDGQGEPSIELAPIEAVADIEIAPVGEQGAPSPPPAMGAWEAAASAAADLSERKSGGFDKYFDPAPPANTVLLSTLGKPGTTSAVSKAAPPDPPNAAAFRTGLAERGGPEPWMCEVLEMGEEVRSPSSPEIEAALAALGESTAEAHYWNIVCKGDEKSHVGPVFVFIPTYEAYPVAKLDGSTATIERYAATRHGLFPEELRGKLHKVGIGTKLRFTKTGWLERRPYASTLFGREWGEPRWATHFGKHTCRHEGLGCERPNGPVVEVVELKVCDVDAYSYP